MRCSQKVVRKSGLNIDGTFLPPAINPSVSTGYKVGRGRGEWADVRDVVG